MIHVASLPGTPTAPTTTLIGENIRVSWTTPDDGGAEITAYLIVIAHSDGVTFTEEVTECDGTLQDIIDNQLCLISSQVLNQFPYEILWAGSVTAKITAYNSKGASQESAEGNGAVLLWGPSAPQNILLNSVLTTRFNAAFTWEAPADNRGTVVIDYQIWYD